MEPLEVSTMFAAGLKVVSWTGKKWHAVMGVAL